MGRTMAYNLAHILFNCNEVTAVFTTASYMAQQISQILELKLSVFINRI